MIFMTESQAAQRLGCSTSTVKRLRLSGKLSYIPGRPVLIDEADLEAYLLARSQADAEKLAKRAETPAESARRIWIIRRARLLAKMKHRT